MKYLVLIIVILLIASGCINNKDDKIVDVNFDKTYSLKTQVIKNTNIYCPYDNAIVNNYLLSVNLCMDTLINAMDLRKMESKYIIPKGNGPHEAIKLEHSGQIKKSDKKTKAGFFDRSRRNFLWIDPQKAWEGINRNMQIEKIPPKIGTIGDDLFRTNDGWAGTDLSGEGLMFFYDENNNNMKWLNFEPKLSYRIPDPRVLSQIYYSETRYNADHLKFICALRYFPLVYIINTKGQIEKKIRFERSYKEPQIKREQGLPDDNTPIYFWNVISTNSYIYILRANITVKDFKNNNLQNTSLYIIDWNGKAQCQINFDATVANIAIDFNNKAIYGVSPKDLENPLVRIEVPVKIKKYFK